LHDGPGAGPALIYLRQVCGRFVHDLRLFVRLGANLSLSWNANVRFFPNIRPIPHFRPALSQRHLDVHVMNTVRLMQGMEGTSRA
jgi:hypothetical protein